MATARPPWTHPAYLLLTFSLAATIVWGFWPSYFGSLLQGGVRRPWIIHLHAAVFIGWVILVVTQALLVTAGALQVHRRVGRAGIVYGVLVLCMGSVISVAAPVMHVRAHTMSAERASLVVLYNLTDILVFAAFFAAAMALVHRPQWHKRLILSATVALSSAAVGRVLPGGTLLYLFVWLLPLFGSMAIDLLHTHRLHAASCLSVPVFLIASFKVQLYALAPTVSDLGQALIRPFV